LRDVFDGQTEVEEFSVLNCWERIEYSKCVYIDATKFVSQNADDLFTRPEFSAAPDFDWPDRFNSSIFVFRPSIKTYNNLLEFKHSNNTLVGTSDILNAYYNEWRESDAKHRLPSIYNIEPDISIVNFKKYASDVKIIRFIDKKPFGYYGSGDDATKIIDIVHRWDEIVTSVMRDLPTDIQLQQLRDNHKELGEQMQQLQRENRRLGLEFRRLGLEIERIQRDRGGLRNQ